MDNRGFDELRISDDEVIRWPRTTGSDVIAIAALFDKSVREMPLRFGGHGLANRWRACVDDLERYALPVPFAEYVENRSFWRTLPSVCVYLHSEHSPLPPTGVWDALLAQLSEPVDVGPRNHGVHPDGVPVHYDEKSLDDIYLSEFQYLRDQRGADKMAPEPGMGGGDRWIPRTTNADVTRLERFWTKMFSTAPRVQGHDATAALWQAARRDVDELARQGADPNAVYPKNNAFWRALQRVAIQTAVGYEMGREQNALFTYVGQRNRGPQGKTPIKQFDVKTFEDLYLAQHKYLLDARGFDWMNPELGMPWFMGSPEMKIPRTTNRDVIELAHYWNDEFARVNRLKNPAGRTNELLDQILKLWATTVRTVDELARSADANAIYAYNNRFWRALQNIALITAVFDAVPGVGGARNVGPKGDSPFNLTASTYSDLQLEQWKYLKELRGSDKLRPDADPKGPERVIPRTTNADVVALADYWNKQLGQVKKVMGHERVETEWKGAMLEVDLIARKGKPDALYIKNNAFWRTLQRTAIQISVADEAPSGTDLAIASLKQAISDLPENIGASFDYVSRGATSLLGEVGEGLGKTANRIGKGLFSGFGTPLLVGAGLVGLFLLSRTGDEKKEA